MSKFIKKPEVVDAIQITEKMILENKAPNGVRLGRLDTYPDDSKPGGRSISSYHFYVETPSEKKEIRIGDWIVVEANGDRDVYKDEVFKAGYDPITQW